MVQMPTGIGKLHSLASVIHEHLQERQRQSVWIATHRRELVEQIEDTVVRYGIRKEEGLVCSTQQAILEDIVASLYAQGMRKLIILSGHGGNNFKGMIRDLAFVYPDFLIIAADWFSIVPPKDYFEAVVDDHAGESETSVMMHYHPELVNLDEAGDGESKPFAIPSLNEKVGWAPRHWDKATVDSGVGNPKKASAEKGERYMKPVVEKLSKLFTEVGQGSLY